MYAPRTSSDLLDSLFGRSGQSNPILSRLLSGGSGSSNLGSGLPAFNQSLVNQEPDPIGRLLGVVSQTRAAQQPEVDPLEEFVKSLAGQIDTSGGLNSADYEQALNQSAHQIKQAFGAEIGAVRASSAAARKQTKRSKKQIKAMYNALNRQYSKSAQAEIAQGQKVANEIQGVANNAQGQVQQSADSILNDQAALAKNLGVESAAPTIIAKQQGNVANTIQNIQTSGQRDASAQIANSGTQQRFLERGGKNALLEGTNRRADLVQQLQDFLQQNLGKIADIKGRQGQALASNTASIAKSFSAGQGDAAQKKFDNGVAIAKLLQSIQSSKSKGGSGSDAMLPKFMQQYDAAVGQTSDPQGIGALLQKVTSSRPFAEGRFEAKNGDTINMTPTEAANIAENQARKNGIDNPQDLALIRLAAMQYYAGVS